MRDLTVSTSAPWRVTTGDSIAGVPVRHVRPVRIRVTRGNTNGSTIELRGVNPKRYPG